MYVEKASFFNFCKDAVALHTWDFLFRFLNWRPFVFSWKKLQRCLFSFNSFFFSFIRSGDQWSTVYSYNMCSMFEQSASLNSRGVFQKLWWNIYRCFGAFCESTNIHCGYYDSASEINWFNLVISPFDNTSWICCLKRQEKVFFFMHACNILKKEEKNYNLKYLLCSVLVLRTFAPIATAHL